MEKKLITSAPEIKDYQPFLPTGNEYVALPEINPHDASIRSVNVISMWAKGLIELRSEDYLISLQLIIAGKKIKLINKNQWKRLNYWLPHFSLKHQGFDLEGTIFAPPGIYGFIYLFSIKNKNKKNKEISLGISGNWSKVNSIALASNSLNAKKCAYYDEWTESLVLEAKPDRGRLAMAIKPSVEMDEIRWGKDMESSASEVAILEGAISFEMVKRFSLPKGKEEVLAFYFALSEERDGARTKAMDMARIGYRKLLNETQDWLSQHQLQTKSNKLTELLNLNLFFNYFYTSGYTIDTEEMVMLSSRSPLYYVAAGFWSRDALIWSFPALLLIDDEMGRKVLLLCFSRYIKNAGDHALYIDGTRLYPGFELDEVCGFLIALDYYLKKTGDGTILSENSIQEGLEVLVKIIKLKKDKKFHLYRTFLLSSDDPAPYPYVTYDNVLVWKTFGILANIYNKIKAKKKIGEYIKLENNLYNEIWKKCVIKTESGKIFAGAVDLKGNFALFDEPTGSLELLPYWGFCKKNDRIYKKTMNLLYSKRNPYYYEGKFTGLGCYHAAYPWLMNLINRLLVGEKKVLKILSELELDNGIACESFEVETGRVKTGRAFASCGGLLAYALEKWVRKNTKN